MRVFHFDPGFAPPGRTAVTVFLPTRNVDFWAELKALDPERYALEKRRVAEGVIGVLEKCMPVLRQAVEVSDVSTPATVIAHTSNFRDSMEGWLPVPGSGFTPLPPTLPRCPASG